MRDPVGEVAFNQNQSWRFIFLDCNVIQFKVSIIHSFALSLKLKLTFK